MQKALKFITIQLKLWRHSSIYNILYMRFHPFGWPTIVWAHWKGIPIVQEMNGTSEDLYAAYSWTKWFRRLIIQLYKLQLSAGDAVICVTPGIKEWLQSELGVETVYVIPNGANVDLFSPDAEVEEHFILEKPYALFFGALSSWQGIDTLLEAIETSAWPKDVRLVIIGDGYERARVEAAAQKNLSVVYIQHVPYAKMPGVIVNSLASISPQKGIRNKYGLYPLKVFESLACGVPVIVTNSPGQAELIRENLCGIVIPEDDPVELAKAINYLYMNPAARLEMGRRGHDAIKEKHSWQKRASDTGKILENILNNYNSKVL